MIHAMLFILIVHVGVNFVGWSLSGSQPAISTALSAGITASDTVIPVDSVSGFPSAGWLYIQGEAVQYADSETPCDTVPFASDPACFTGASRGQLETDAISHAIDARVYSEASGLLNNLSGFEARTSIDELGEITSLWGSGLAIVNFLSHAATWDWPMFEGDLAFARVIGGLFTTAAMLGIFYLLGTLLVSAIRTVLP